MKFVETPLAGAFLVIAEPSADERGSFARHFDAEQFRSRGLEVRIAQCSTSFNTRSGTLRGMHLQREPHVETKLIRCSRGAVYDVIVDLRPSSPTYCDWYSVELQEEDSQCLYVPEGFAHGFQTLADATELGYQISTPFEPASADGVRFDDPAFSIEWPSSEHLIINDRDRSWPDISR